MIYIEQSHFYYLEYLVKKMLKQKIIENIIVQRIVENLSKFQN